MGRGKTPVPRQTSRLPVLAFPKGNKDRSLLPGHSSPSLVIASLRQTPLTFLLWAYFAFAAFCVPSSVSAENISEHPAKTPESKNGRMLVEANELRYDNSKNTVAAVGDARIYYQGRLLEADEVIYDKNTNRVYAEGHASLTERDGTVTHAERFDLTEDFRNGFIESLRVDTKEKTHFSAPRVERIEEDTTIFDKGTYTACQSCKDNPDKPPLWQVRAKHIIDKNDDHMIYFQDATLEFLGIPLAYIPYFSAPDPTVKRKSGILSPHLSYNGALGFGVGLPIFWALAPDYDLTVTPTVYSKQGFFGSAEWRQRFENGAYYLRANGIFQNNPGAFSYPPYGGGDRTGRGDIESKGQFYIDPQWKYGWEFTLLSDKWFLNDYGVPNQTLSSNYFSEVTSAVYLTGQGGRGYFDLHGYHFEGLSSHDFQPQQPLVHPVLDYNKTFDVDPAKSLGLGGQVEFDFNVTSISATAASFQAVGPRVLDNAYGLYDICTNYVPGRTNGDCLLRGIGGDYNRATAEVSWKRKYIDPIGEVWTPFAFARVNGQLLDLNTTDSFSFSSVYGSSSYSNGAQYNFVGNQTQSADGNFVPGIGLEYRYPFFTKMSFASMTFEPIGQIIVRPNQLGSQSLVNLDSQSLVFDETNLFSWSKYSGYDRFETGTRINYGAQYTMNFNGGGSVKWIGGQSYQVAGVNPYSIPDAANIGLESGLDTRRSDYVTGVTIAPSTALSFIAKGRFDVDTFEPKRIDLITNYNLGAWTGGIQFADYEAQPVLGYDVRREGLSFNSKYKITDNYFAQGNITFDMSRHLYPPELIGYSNPGLFAIAAFGVGAGYQDDCTSFSVNFSSVYQDNGSGSLVRNDTVLVQLQLRTLGDARFSQTFTNTSALDGVKY